MKNTPNHKPESEKPRKISEPSIKKEIDQLPPIPEAIESLAKLSLPPDPLGNLSPWVRKIALEKKELQAAKEHAIYELVVLKIPEMLESEKDLQEKIQFDLAHEIEYLSTHPHTITKLTPQIRNILIEQFPTFVLTLLGNFEVSKEEGQKLLQQMIEKLGARRVMLTGKTLSKMVWDKLATLIVDMAGTKNKDIEREPENKQIVKNRDAGIDVLVSGPIDSLLHFDPKGKVNLEELTSAMKLIFKPNYKEHTERVLDQYPRKELLTLMRNAGHYINEETKEKILSLLTYKKKGQVAELVETKLSRERVWEIFSKNEPEETLEKVFEFWNLGNGSQKEDLKAPESPEMPKKTFKKPKE